MIIAIFSLSVQFHRFTRLLPDCLLELT